MGNRKVFLLVDYRGIFYSSTREVAGTMDVGKIKELLELHGYEVFVESFSEVDFRSRKYHNSFVLYQSSEDPDLRYKDYVEDVLLGLGLAGAFLVPRFVHFRAHHNKVFMEILRDTSGFEAIQSIQSRVYGACEELKAQTNSVVYPAVIKPGAGSRSYSVQLCVDQDSLLRVARLISRSFSTINLRRFISGVISGKGFKPISQHRRKFIVQNYIEGLSGDFKVLAYADKFYVLYRMNRVNDFRASGSGLLSYPDTTPHAVLDYAEAVFAHLDTPFVSLDIALRGRELFLLEFQFLSFGQYALEHSDHYYTKIGDVWRRIEGRSGLEETFVYAVYAYLQRNQS